MRIQMLETKLGAENGITVRVFERGTTYEVGDSFAQCLIEHGWASRAGDAEPVAAARVATSDEEWAATRGIVAGGVGRGAVA
jgi:hypothetical protein